MRKRGQKVKLENILPLAPACTTVHETREEGEASPAGEEESVY